MEDENSDFSKLSLRVSKNERRSKSRSRNSFLFLRGFYIQEDRIVLGDNFTPSSRQAYGNAKDLSSVFWREGDWHRIRTRNHPNAKNQRTAFRRNYRVVG